MNKLIEIKKKFNKVNQTRILHQESARICLPKK